MDETVFITGVFVGMFITMIAGSLWVMKPRFDELMESRNLWRDRALHAEDSAQAQYDADLEILGSWGSAVDDVT